jgi:hypothetical protein
VPRCLRVRHQERTADVIGNAVHITRIATGEIEDETRDPAKEQLRRRGLKGVKARAKKRSEIAKKGARARLRGLGSGGIAREFPSLLTAGVFGRNQRDSSHFRECEEGDLNPEEAAKKGGKS